MVLWHQNAGPKMGPVSEPSATVPVLEGSRNGSEFGARCWPRFSPFLSAGFDKEWLQAGIAVKVTIFHSFFRFYAAIMTGFRDNDSNNVVQLCN